MSFCARRLFSSTLLAAGVGIHFASPPRALAAIDFTPHRAEILEDGVPVVVTYCTDGPVHIILDPPRTWRWQGAGNTLTLSPQGVTQSILRIEEIHTPKPLAFDELNLVSLRRQAAAALPSSARDAAAVYESADAFPLYDWKGFEIMHTYSYYGQLFTRSTFFLTISEGRTLRVTIEASRADFDKHYTQARQTLASWFEPERHLPPEVAKGFAVRLQAAQ